VSRESYFVLTARVYRG